jgi:hypothetical protein
VSERHPISTACSGFSHVASLHEPSDFQRHHFDCLHAVRPPLVQLQAVSASSTCVRLFVSTNPPLRSASTPAHAEQPDERAEPARCQPLREPIEKYRPASSEVRRSSFVRVLCVSVCVQVECLPQRGFLFVFFPAATLAPKHTHNQKYQFECRFLVREFSCEDFITSRRTRNHYT